MSNALRTYQRMAACLVATTLCVAGCKSPAVWVAPEYSGPKITAFSWPQHAPQVCKAPPCFGYHAGVWRAWPCPETGYSRMDADSQSSAEPMAEPPVDVSPTPAPRGIPQSPADFEVGPMPSPPPPPPVVPQHGAGSATPSAASPSDKPAASWPEPAVAPPASGNGGDEGSWVPVTPPSAPPATPPTPSTTPPTPRTTPSTTPPTTPASAPMSRSPQPAMRPFAPVVPDGGTPSSSVDPPEARLPIALFDSGSSGRRATPGVDRPTQESLAAEKTTPRHEAASPPETFVLVRPRKRPTRPTAPEPQTPSETAMPLKTATPPMSARPARVVVLESEEPAVPLALQGEKPAAPLFAPPSLSIVESDEEVEASSSPKPLVMVEESPLAPLALPSPLPERRTVTSSAAAVSKSEPKAAEDTKARSQVQVAKVETPVRPMPGDGTAQVADSPYQIGEATIGSGPDDPNAVGEATLWEQRP